MTFPSIKELADEVYEFGRYLKRSYDPADIADDDGNPGGDCRLQVVDGGWNFHTGDSSFDQDHRGSWGAGWTPAGCTRAQSMEIARGLIDEARDSY